MTSPSTTVCWPTRFGIKWLVALLSSLAIGMILAAFLRKPVTPYNVQARVQVRIRYSGGDFMPTAADIYLSKPEEEIRDDRRFYVDIHGEPLKALTGGLPTDLKVWPKDRQGHHEGVPAIKRVVWPMQDREIRQIDIDRPYTKPQWSR